MMKIGDGGFHRAVGFSVENYRSLWYSEEGVKRCWMDVAIATLVNILNFRLKYNIKNKVYI